MTDSKPWWQSTGMWGGIAAFLAVVAGFFGYSFSAEDQQVLVMTVSGGVGIVGTLIGLWGRLRASKKIGSQ